MHYETLACSLSDRVLTITLNRPERLNAFTVQMAEDLSAAFNRASDDDAVGVTPRRSDVADPDRAPRAYGHNAARIVGAAA